MATIQTSMRLDEKQFSEAKEILSHLGLNFTEAVNIFTNMVVLNRGLPFDVKIPNQETVAILKDIRKGEGLEEITLDDLKKVSSTK